MAAQYADGFNLPYVSPAEFRERMEQLELACDRLGRDPAGISRSVNLHFLMAADETGARRAGERLEKMTPDRRQGALTGTAQEVIDRIGEYMDAGAEGLNIAFRAPIDWEAFEAYIENVLPVFHRPA
jgi:alkanesulfonate monooxygenase SsuD/methylene tetrahydromethanopterin reductase-like flavin-dependent oxidoreductase (luciferase family)